MQLREGWRAALADDALRRSYQTAGFDDRDWEPLAVPSHWRSTPAFADADGPLLQRCRFAAPAPAGGRRAWLTFEGIFYQGDVWLDDAYLGDTEGYFVPHTFEVTDALRTRDEHVLGVEVTCAPERDRTAKRNLTGVFQDTDSLDPTWNPGGVWRPVFLTHTGPVRIARLRVLCRDATAERATLILRATLDSDAARTVRVRTELGELDHELDQPLAAGPNDVSWTLTVERPALWWPRTLGDATLHDVRVAVLVADGETDRPGGDGDHPGGPGDGGPSDDSPREGGRVDGGGVLSDERRLRTGLRAVRLRRWVCSVNGERLFLKGAHVGPTRQALAEATPAEVRRDVDLAVEAGLDLVRVHAHVGRPELYDAADEQGLLLWQDLPLRGGYVRNVRRQAARQARAAVDLLGHHPAVALWCGHDDPDGADLDPPRPGAGARSPARRVLGAVATQQLPSWNRSVLDGSIRRALDKADGSRPVVAHSGVLPHPPRLDGTDSHLYPGWEWGDVRDLGGLARALPRLVRFVGAFGAEAVPSGDAAFCNPERWPDLDWERLAAHHGLHREPFDRYVPPEDHETFDDWRQATQRHQAEVVRRHVETLRRLKYRPVGGFALRALADAHPAVSWGVLGHDRAPKLAWEALRQACRPVIVVADRLPAHPAAGEALALDVHVVSDLRVPVDGARVAARLSWPGGTHAWAWRGAVDADACVRVGTLQTVVPDAAGTVALDLALHLPGGEVVRNRDEVRMGT